MSACWNYRAGWGCAALARCEIKPGSVNAPRTFHVVQADIDVALCIIAVLSRDIRPRAGQKRHRQFRETQSEILESCTVSTEIERIEIVDFNMLAPVISFARPEDRARLTVAEEAPSANKGLAQSK